MANLNEGENVLYKPDEDQDDSIKEEDIRLEF